MSGRLQNKVAIITGATSGIGRATAFLFAKEGASVIISGRRESLGNEVVEEIQSQGGEATFVQADLTIKEDMKRIVKTAVDCYGTIDILVNNAATVTNFNFLEMDEVKDFDIVFNTNVKAPFLLTKEVLPYLIEKKKGSIVNVASIGAEIAIPYRVTYSASKGAIRMFTKSLAGEMASKGIRVNAVLPGTTNTEMNPLDSEGYKEALKKYPMGRGAIPEEMAQGILYLASDESSFCTGSMLTIDGGRTLMA